MNWIPFVIWILLGVSLGVWATWIAISAEAYDKKMHVPGKLCSWNHIEVMACYYTAATVIGAIALAILVITVMIWAMK